MQDAKLYPEPFCEGKIYWKSINETEFQAYHVVAWFTGFTCHPTTFFQFGIYQKYICLLCPSPTQLGPFYWHDNFYRVIADVRIPLKWKVLLSYIVILEYKTTPADHLLRAEVPTHASASHFLPGLTGRKTEEEDLFISIAGSFTVTQSKN